MTKKKICHFTIAHRLEDERIFHKECASLSAEYDVTLVSTSNYSEIKNEINTIGLGAAKGLFQRIKRIITIIPILLRQRCILYHFHDPDLIFTGFILKIFFRKKVVYDVHEHYQSKILSRKPTKNKFIDKTLSVCWGAIERLLSKTFDLIVTADSYTAKQFDSSKTIILPNVPPLSFCRGFSINKKISEGEYNIVYLGSIHKQRGLVKCVEVVNKINIANVKLHIIGESKYPELTRLFESSDRVIYHGRIPWELLNQTLAKMDVGMILLQPVPAFTYSPGENIVKLFEYAGLGIPYIISDFPGIRKFVKKNKGGLLVDPTNERDIILAIEKLFKNRILYNNLSSEGRDMVLNEYNWDRQVQKLFDGYDKLLS